MSIFICELKKIWNFRVLLLITAIGVLTFFAFLYPAIKGYNNFHGIYGDYQKEMFDKYGDTLEPNELFDYGIPAIRADVEAQLNEIIEGDPLFEKYKIYSVADLDKIHLYDEAWSQEETAQREIDRWAMEGKLDAGLDWLDGLRVKLQSLDALELRYVEQANGGDNTKHYILNDNRPVVRRQAAEYFESHTGNLIRYDLTNCFSLYAAITGVFSVIAVLALVAPLLTIDRSQKLHYMQYSSKTGRKIVKMQLAATTFSAVVLTLVLSVLSYSAFFFGTDAPKYLNAHIADFSTAIFYMYNFAFWQYTLILAGMTLAFGVCAACIAFVLSRFSTNVVTMLIKAVPVGGAVAGITALAVNSSLSNWNIIFTSVFRGRVDFAEVLLGVAIALVAVVAAVFILIREKRVEVV